MNQEANGTNITDANIAPLSSGLVFYAHVGSDATTEDEPIVLPRFSTRCMRPWLIGQFLNP